MRCSALQRGGRLGQTAPGRLRFGRAGRGQGDEVVAVRLEGAQPVVEIHCHGGIAAVASLVHSLQEAGAALADHAPTWLDGHADRLCAAAFADLASAPATLRAAEILLDQSRGALGRAIERLLVDAQHSIASCIEGLDALIRRGAVGTRLIDGWKVVIAGRPNVGKSRLFNALAGFDRAIVDPAPGVTRDVVSFRTAFSGWPVELCDTAGERETDDAVERLGIARSRHAKGDADLVLLVLDRSEPLQPVDRELLEISTSAIAVANKSDLPPAWDASTREVLEGKVLAVSAETGAGFADLVAAIAHRLVPDPPAPEAAVPFRPGHMRSLEAARACRCCGAGSFRGGLLRRLEELRGVELALGSQ